MPHREAASERRDAALSVLLDAIGRDTVLELGGSDTMPTGETYLFTGGPDGTVVVIAWAQSDTAELALPTGGLVIAAVSAQAHRFGEGTHVELEVALAADGGGSTVTLDPPLTSSETLLLVIPGP